MRHNKSFNHLGRTKAHRKAMLSNMSASLILHKRIKTTLPKARALKTFVEPIITRAKESSDHNHRMVFKVLQNKEATKELFNTVGPKVATRSGGYTRILKTGYRLGDNAQTCIIELVDFNEIWLSDVAASQAKSEMKPKRTRRSRKSSSKKASEATDNARLQKSEVQDVEEAPEKEAKPEEW